MAALGEVGEKLFIGVTAKRRLKGQKNSPLRTMVLNDGLVICFVLAFAWLCFIVRPQSDSHGRAGIDRAGYRYFTIKRENQLLCDRQT